MLGVPERRILVQKAAGLHDGAAALLGYQEEAPDVVTQAALDVPALEIRGILAGGALGRVQAAAARDAQVHPDDLEAVSRLDSLLATADARLANLGRSLDAQASGNIVESLAGWVGLAGGVVGLYKALF